jgi:hypothetical protein
MAIQNNGRKIYSAAHSVSFNEPVGASFSLICDVQENRPGTVITDESLTITGVKTLARVKFQGITTPITPGTKSNLSVVVQTFDNSLCGDGGGAGGLTVSCPDMAALDTEIDLESSPSTQTANFRYRGTSIQPISVAA